MQALVRNLVVLAATLSLAAACGRDTGSEASLDAAQTTGTYYTDAQLKRIALSAGFKDWEANTMVNIAKCESSGRAGSWNGNSSKGQHTGLWQVGDYHYKPCGYASVTSFRKAMMEPYANARCAYVVYTGSHGQGMKGFGNWDCYTGKR